MGFDRLSVKFLTSRASCYATERTRRIKFDTEAEVQLAVGGFLLWLDSDFGCRLSPAPANRFSVFGSFDSIGREQSLRGKLWGECAKITKLL